MSEESGGPGAFTTGSLIGGYRLEQQIGRGGMAVVFRAYDPRLNRRVALKILAPALTHDTAFRQRFIHESRAAAAVDDPHIIPVFEAGEADGVLFIAMRFARGGDVRLLLDREGPLPPERAVDIVSQVASALDSAHAFGLVHRDVKPANMLLDVGAGSGRRDHVYLSDFGLTKTSLAASGLTGSGQWLGTVDYVAPEQILGQRVDGRADLYALGCATFELLAGAPPFRREQEMAVMYAQVNEAPPPLSAQRVGLPPAADAVMNRVLAKSPDDRYTNGWDFIDALRQALGLERVGVRTASETPAGPPTQTAAPVPRPYAVADPSTVSARYASGQPAQLGSGGGVAGDRAHPGQPPDADAPGRSEEPGGLAPAGASGGRPGKELGGSGGRRWPRWRSPILAAAACFVIVVAVGGYFLFSRGGGRGASASGSETRSFPAPGYTTSTPKLTILGVASHETDVHGTPFGAQESPDDHYTFVTVGNGIAVLSNNGGLASKFLHTAPAPDAKRGLILTSEGRDLIAAGGRGAVVISVAAAERGTSHVVAGKLTGPQGHSGAIGVLLAPGGRYLFVTLEASRSIAVFDFGLAQQSGFATSGFKGLIPLGSQPVGLSFSPNGQLLYATNSNGPATLHRPPACNGQNEGRLSVINVSTAETHPGASAVVRTVMAGCSPQDILFQRSTGTVWVTARDSNALLGFSARRLLSDPARALIAVVPVGPRPLGLTLAANGRIVVADSSWHSSSPGYLAVVSSAEALAGKRALLGVVPTKGQPLEVIPADHGGILLATIQAIRPPASPPAGWLQAVNAAGLP